MLQTSKSGDLAAIYCQEWRLSPGMRRSAIWFALAFIGFSISERATAQGLEEIVVTATKRGELTIQDTPLSVQSLGGGDLLEAGDLDFDDFYRQVPGLSVSDQGPADKRYIIRGVTTTGAGTVGLYFDEIIVTGENVFGEGGKQPDIKLFDMDRIEILRGPQGTTFGSSSLTGAIRWIPNAPVYDELQAEAGASIAASKESSDVSWKFDGMVNIPIVEDTLALRISGFVLDGAGYIDNRFEKDANAEDTTAGRAILAWNASENLVISLMAMSQRMDVDGRNFYNRRNYALPNSPSLNGQELPEKYYNAELSRSGITDDVDMYSIKAEFSQDWGVFTAVSSVFQNETDHIRSVTAAGEILSGGLLPADGAGRSVLNVWKDRELQSNELRFASTWDSPVQILVGGFFQSETSDNRTSFVTTDPVSGRIVPDSIDFLKNLTDKSQDELAFFGEVSWDITDKLTVTGGGRWFDFDMDYQTTVVTQFLSVPGPGAGPVITYAEDGSIFKGNISYKVNDDVLVYAQVGEGFRAGGPNDQTAAAINNVVIPAGFDSDSLVNYELGIKSSWFENRLILNGAVYRIDWSDIQTRNQARDENTGIQFAYIGNGGKAEVNGVELELYAYPMEGLNIGMSFAYTDAELTEDLPIPVDGLAGDPIPFVPDTTFSLDARYEKPLANGWRGFVGGDWGYVSSYGNRLRDTDRFYRKTDDYSILNMRLGVQTDGWSAILSVENVLDTDTTTHYSFDFVGPPGAPGTFLPDNEVRPWPRTFSVLLRKTFY